LKLKSSIKVKASFLLIVFTLNTIVGAACAMGLDMGFNSKHHSEPKPKQAAVHVHANGKKHVHQKTEPAPQAHHRKKTDNKKAGHNHINGEKHSHGETVGKHTPKRTQPQDEANTDKGSNNEKESCCNDEVIEFQQLDKSVVQSLSIVNPIFFTLFISTFYNIDFTFISQGTPSIRYFVRSHHPPIASATAFPALAASVELSSVNAFFSFR